MIILAGNPFGIASLFLFMPVMGFLGGLIAGAAGLVGGIIGGGKSKKAFKTQQTAFDRIKQQQQKTILSLQSQLAQKKKTNLLPIFLIGGVGLTGFFLFRR